jgi:hypothetical protein
VKTHQGAKPGLYTDDTSVLLTARNDEELKITLMVHQTNIMKFTSSSQHNETFQITYQNKIITGIYNTKCLGLELVKNISWKNHVKKIIPKLSSACYLVRRMYPCCKSTTLKMIYFANFHAVMEYGIIFWGNSVESKRIFQQQNE